MLCCSAGVGRTGAFIALDFLLEQAEIEGTIDVFGLTSRMRKDRVNMIQTVVCFILLFPTL
jgi:protein tyrosine phosphatase